MFPWIFLGKGFWDLLEINWYEWLALYAVSCRQLAATFLSSFSVIFSIFSLSRPFLVEWLHKLKLLYSYIKWFINQWVHPFKTTSSSLSPLMTIWNFAVGVVWKWGASASFAGRLVFAEMNWHKKIAKMYWFHEWLNKELWNQVFTDPRFLQLRKCANSLQST